MFALLRDLRLAWLAFRSCAVFSCAFVWRALCFTCFSSALVVPERSSGSGARGLIKAPAGSGAGPGSGSVFRSCGLGCPTYFPSLWGGVGAGVSGPSGPDSTGRLLDLPVRTDTKGGSRGFQGVVSDPLFLVRCEICGRPLSMCRCDPGRDY